MMVIYTNHLAGTMMIYEFAWAGGALGICKDRLLWNHNIEMIPKH